jgi:hypothetical protein
MPGETHVRKTWTTVFKAQVSVKSFIKCAFGFVQIIVPRGKGYKWRGTQHIPLLLPSSKFKSVSPRCYWHVLSHILPYVKLGSLLCQATLLPEILGEFEWTEGMNGAWPVVWTTAGTAELRAEQCAAYHGKKTFLTPKGSPKSFLILRHRALHFPCTCLHLRHDNVLASLTDTQAYAVGASMQQGIAVAKVCRTMIPHLVQTEVRRLWAHSLEYFFSQHSKCLFGKIEWLPCFL